jgi:hypothetical protein
MVRRFILAVTMAIVSAPVLYALPVQATSHIPWLRLSEAAIWALCHHIGICFGSTP